jgi:archaemetzincin
MPGIDIVPLYFADGEETLHRLGLALERAFGTVVRYRTPWFDPEDAFEPSRGQYRATYLLKALLDDPQDGPSDRILGVTNVDLFTPVLTYVFGEAQLSGRAAVVSCHRLRNEVYGLPPDPRLFFDRLRKEAVHELGHTYGLLHCGNIGCVMRASSYAEELELKSDAFCEACRAVLTHRGANGKLLDSPA